MRGFLFALASAALAASCANGPPIDGNEVANAFATHDRFVFTDAIVREFATQDEGVGVAAHEVCHKRLDHLRRFIPGDIRAEIEADLCAVRFLKACGWQPTVYVGFLDRQARARPAIAGRLAPRLAALRAYTVEDVPCILPAAPSAQRGEPRAAS